MIPAGFDLDGFVERTLFEDLGAVDAAGDITATACLAADARLAAVLESRDEVVVAGLDVAAAFFRRLDSGCTIVPLVADGAAVPPGTRLLAIEGNARALLAAERSALNILQHMTGIATLVRRYVRSMAATRAVLLDTRKTLPGLRALEKLAVVLGGGRNHRMGLYDAPMVKDNHIAACGSVAAAVAACKRAGLADITVEVDHPGQIEAALAAGADRLLLDNMAPGMLRRAVAMVAGRVPTEASGGVNLETVAAIAETGVDYVSVGRITQSAPAADIGMDYLDRRPGRTA